MRSRVSSELSFHRCNCGISTYAPWKTCRPYCSRCLIPVSRRRYPNNRNTLASGWRRQGVQRVLPRSILARVLQTSRETRHAAVFGVCAPQNQQVATEPCSAQYMLNTFKACFIIVTALRRRHPVTWLMLNFYILRNTTSSKIFKFLQHVSACYWPSSGRCTVDYTRKRKLYQYEVSALQKLDRPVTLRLVFRQEAMYV